MRQRPPAQGNRPGHPRQLTGPTRHRSPHDGAQGLNLTGQGSASPLLQRGASGIIPGSGGQTRLRSDNQTLARVIRALQRVGVTVLDQVIAQARSTHPGCPFKHRGIRNHWYMPVRLARRSDGIPGIRMPSICQENPIEGLRPPWTPTAPLRRREESGDAPTMKNHVMPTAVAAPLPLDASRLSDGGRNPRCSCRDDHGRFLGPPAGVWA